jgi:protein-S-isoprenylcysteine O-methyltransferase Ste14
MTQASAAPASSAIPPKTSAVAITPHLAAQVAGRFAAMTMVVIAILFLPAWTARWWQGWVFLATYLGFSLAAFFFFLKTDPQLVERRLRGREQVREQRLLIRSAAPLLAGIFALPGFDHRFGWSRAWLGAEPTWLEMGSLAMMLGTDLAMVWVFWTNRYAARTIRVEEGQTVITSGPYRLVRHPMYPFSFLMFAFALLALGSYASLPALLLFVPIYVLRILNEEKVLSAELPGYTEYCERTRWRMVPGIW